MPKTGIHRNRLSFYTCTHTRKSICGFNYSFWLNMANRSHSRTRWHVVRETSLDTSENLPKNQSPPPHTHTDYYLLNFKISVYTITLTQKRQVAPLGVRMND